MQKLFGHFFSKSRKGCSFFSTLPLNYLKVAKSLQSLTFQNQINQSLENMESSSILETLAYMHFFIGKINLSNDRIEEKSTDEKPYFALQANSIQAKELAEKLKIKVFQDIDSWNFSQAALYSDCLGTQKSMDISFWQRMEEKLLENLYYDHKSGHLIPVFLEGIISRGCDISFNLLNSYLIFLQNNHNKIFGNTLVHMTKTLIQMKNHYKDERLVKDYNNICNFLVQKSKNNLPLLDFQGLIHLSIILSSENQLTDKFCKYVEDEVSTGLKTESKQIYQLYDVWHQEKKGSIKFWSGLVGSVLGDCVSEGGKDITEVLEFVGCVGRLDQESKKQVMGAIVEVADKIEIAYLISLIEKIRKLKFDDEEMWGKLEKRTEFFWKYFDDKEKNQLKIMFDTQGKMGFWK